MGNGYPAAAFGGRREVMAMLPKEVSHGGTYAGNRVAASAATAVLREIRDTDLIADVGRTGLRVQAGLAQVIRRQGLPFVFTGVPQMFGVMFTDSLPDDYRGWADTDHHLYDSVAVKMRRHGAFPEPDSREPWFMSQAHGAGDIVDRVVSAFEISLEEALDERARTIEGARHRVS
jgi:glutamate-1-semialdehyde 2,1-aminomutase